LPLLKFQPSYEYDVGDIQVHKSVFPQLHPDDLLCHLNTGSRMTAFPKLLSRQNAQKAVRNIVNFKVIHRENC